MSAAAEAALGALPLNLSLPARAYAELVEFSEAKGIDARALGARVLVEFLRQQRETSKPKKPHKRYHRLNDVELLSLRKRALTGASVADLAAEFYVAEETVRKHLKYLLTEAEKAALCRGEVPASAAKGK